MTSAPLFRTPSSTPPKYPSTPLPLVNNCAPSVSSTSMSTHPHPLKLQSPNNSKYQKKILFQDENDSSDDVKDCYNNDSNDDVKDCYNNPLFDKRCMSKLLIKESENHFVIKDSDDGGCSSKNVETEIIFSKPFIL